MSSSTRLYRYIALASYLALLGWVALWQFSLNEFHQYSSVFIVLFYILPLLLPMKGIVQARPYTHAWANFVVMFYLIHGITVAYAVTEERLYAGVEIFLSAIMFVSCSLFARARGRELGLGLKKLKTEMQKEKDLFEGEP